MPTYDAFNRVGHRLIRRFVFFFARRTLCDSRCYYRDSGTSTEARRVRAERHQGRVCLARSAYSLYLWVGCPIGYV